MATNGVKTALKLFHYIAPISVVIYFVLAKTVAACFLHQPSKRAGLASRRYAAIGLLVGVLVTIVAQGTVYVLEATRDPEWSSSQDAAVYVLADLLAYASLTVGIAENRKPIWHQYIGAWTVGLVMEVALTTLQPLAEPTRNRYAILCEIFHVLRTLFLLILTVGGWACTLYDRQKLVSGKEAEPLLSHETNGHATKPAGYGAVTANGNGVTPHETDEDEDFDVDSDSEEPDRDKELKATQKKRLEASGSWLNYFKGFRIFIPMLWPYKNRFVQSCLGVVALVTLAERFLNVLVPRQIGIITDQLTEGGGNGVVPWRALGFWMLFNTLSSSAGLSLVKSLAEIPVQQFSYKSIGSSAFGHIMTLSMDFHNEKNSGELIRAVEQGQHLQGLLEFFLFEVGPMFTDLIIGFVYVYTLFDVYMTLILMGVGLAYIYIGAKTTTWSVKARRNFNNAWRNEAKVQNEAIANWSTVSHFNRGSYEKERYSKSIDEFNAAEWKYDIAYYIGGSAQSVVMLVGRLAAFSMAVYRVAQGRAPVGNFVTLTLYWRSIESPLMQVSWSVRRLSSMLTDSERLLQLMMTKPTVASAPDAPDIVIKEGEVEFDHVDFAYDPRRPTLKDVSFTAKPGQTIALVGETGGGKSTIIKLLYRYYDIGSGSIRIDGQDIRNVNLDSLRDSFGMVPQDPALFNISLIENIRYARLDATDADIVEACRAAAIHDKIESFPDGYKSTVGERGVKLSGGELQRVSIARAILRQPKIVLLDEATSMIDAETEAVIQKAFRRLTAGRTTFIIAHRLSTIQHADLILVVGDGRVVERGTHEELIQRGGKYVALWSKQLSRDVGEVGEALGDVEPEQAVLGVATGTSEATAAEEAGSDER
ncbi:hypothetical protein LTR29_010303 [Friedmanniomyces endolithicus]|nr:hypothetical protein LTR29_010303 [Friedmanniomyces endolithicus]